MSFERNQIQVFFETKTGCNDTLKWGSYLRQLVSIELNKDDVDALVLNANSDSISYYRKALLSFLEALSGIRQNRPSWAIVKLYYAVFYLIRAEIIIAGQ